MSKEERFEYDSSDLCGDTIIDNKENKRIDDDLSIITKLLNQQDQRIAELEEQLQKYLESNNDLLKQITELEAQLIKERLKGEKKCK